MEEKIKTMSGFCRKNTEIILFSILAIILISMTLVSGTISAFTITSPANNSNTSDTTPNIVFTAVSDLNATFSCNVVINGSNMGINASTANNTETTITCNQTLPSDGLYEVTVSCTDCNGTVASTTYEFNLDTVSPVLTLNSPTTTTGSYDQEWIYINVSAVDADRGLHSINITLYNSTGSVINQTTNTSSPAVWNMTTIPDGTYYLNVTANDTVGNEGNSETYTIIIDTTDPVNSIAFTNNTGATDMTFTFTTTVTDEDLSSCYYTIYQNSSETNVTGTVSGSASSYTCTGDITYSDFSYNGYFIMEVNTEDNAGNTDSDNQTNLTINKLESGWNLIQAERNSTLGTFNYTGLVTKVSLYSNANQNYTSYVVGVAANENTNITDGDAVYVYVSADSYYLRTWAIDLASRNLTYSSGWNQATHFNTTNIYTEDLCDETIDNSSADIRYVTYVDTLGTYQSHRCGFTFNNLTIPRGYGYWLYLNTTTTQGRNRE